VHTVMMYSWGFLGFNSRLLVALASLMSFILLKGSSRS